MALRKSVQTKDFLPVLIKNQLRVDTALASHRIDPIRLLFWWFSLDVFVPIKRKILTSQNSMVKNQGRWWMQAVWRGYLPATLPFLSPVPGSHRSRGEQEGPPGHHTEEWQRSLPTSSVAAIWNKLTWTFPHTSGSKAVFSIRVDIHLISGGVIQDQWGTRILARSIIPKLATCLSLNNTSH